MTESAALASWFNETMTVVFTDGTIMEGRLMGADEVGLEFEFLRNLRATDEGFVGKEPNRGDPAFFFAPWAQVKMLMRS